MKSSFCVVLAVFGLLFVLSSGAKMPAMPCTFSTDYIETWDYHVSATPMRRIYAALRSNIPSVRAAAKEALKRAAAAGATGNDDDLPKFGDEQYRLTWYSVEDISAAQVMDTNETYIWQTPATWTMIYPFFDRYSCAKFVSRDIPLIHCPEFPTSNVKHDRIETCPNHPDKECDVWVWWSYDYSESQEAYMIKGTNILDLVTVDNEDYSLREDFINMDTTKPDASHFAPAKDQPCTDMVSDPTNKAQTFTTKSYPGKNLRLASLSSMMQQSRRYIGGESQNFYSHPLRAIPESFDARKQWPQCDTIKAIRDQGTCGSCWAFGAAESFGDRYCVSTGESITFSPQHLIDCYTDDDGCDGGILDLTWIDLIKQGIVTDECKPYSGVDHDCSFSCNNSKHSDPKFYYAKNAYSIYTAFDYNKTVRGIQEEIMTRGPVEASFYVLSDFLQYSSGVYQRTAGAEYAGGHAIKIIGWGVDEKTKVPYWLIANSWGDDWGENGFFRIRRGTDECGIESQIATGLVKA